MWDRPIKEVLVDLDSGNVKVVAKASVTEEALKKAVVCI